MPGLLLKLDDLTITFRGRSGERTVVERASLELQRGETLALAGASGSGKTLLARAIVGLLPPNALVRSGRLAFAGEHYDLARPTGLAGLRGRAVGYVFQEPLSTLNPVLKMGIQVTECLRFHSRRTNHECRELAHEMLERVGFTDPRRAMDSYPHQLSGGMRQRVMIAAAAIMRPSLLVADEPTTALDTVIQDEVLRLIRELAREAGTSVLLITHDLGMAATVADSIGIMRQGVIVESGPADSVLRSPRHPYTRELLASTPEARPADAPPRPDGNQAIAIDVRDISVSFAARAGATTNALRGVSFALAPGETLGIVGESGSGKTTLSRVVAGLQGHDAGEVRLDRRPADSPGDAPRGLQFIFQDSAGSLDPRMRIADIVTEGLRFRPGWSAARRREKAREALAVVHLDESILDRFAHQLSGGQRQRVSIARAVVMNPAVVLADEPFSALDLGAQQQVLALFLALKRQHGFACLFISHDLDIVERIADRVGVLYRGVLVEIGPAQAIFRRPRHPYTRRLLASGARLVAEAGGGFRAARRRLEPQDGELGARACDPAGPQAPFHYSQIGDRHFVAVRQ